MYVTHKFTRAFISLFVSFITFFVLWSCFSLCYSRIYESIRIKEKWSQFCVPHCSIHSVIVAREKNFHKWHSRGRFSSLMYAYVRIACLCFPSTVRESQLFFESRSVHLLLHCKSKECCSTTVHLNSKAKFRASGFFDSFFFSSLNPTALLLFFLHLGQEDEVRTIKTKVRDRETVVAIHTLSIMIIFRKTTWFHSTTKFSGHSCELPLFCRVAKRYLH